MTGTDDDFTVSSGSQANTDKSDAGLDPGTPEPSRPDDSYDRSETDAGHQSSSPDDVLSDQSTFKNRGTVPDPSQD